VQVVAGVIRQRERDRVATDLFAAAGPDSDRPLSDFGDAHFKPNAWRISCGDDCSGLA